MPVGKYEIDDQNVYAMVQAYNSKPLAEGKWEAHKQYIDIQYVADGIEKIGFAPIGHMKVAQDYDAAKDFMLLEGSGDFVTVRKGTFVILFPGDAHMPGMAVNEPEPVKKVVVKVKV